MSARALMWVANLRGITLAERGVLQKLGNHAHKDGTSARPSVATIAAWADLEPRQVRRILGRLLARQLISTGDSERSRVGGRNRTTVYTVVIPEDYDPRTWREVEVPPMPPEAKGGHFQHAAETDLTTERRTFSTNGGAEKVDIFDTERRTLMSSQPVPEPVLRKTNRSVLAHGSQTRSRDETKTDSAISANSVRPDPFDVMHPDDTLTDFEILSSELTPHLVQWGCEPHQAEGLLEDLVKKCGGDCGRAADMVRRSQAITIADRIGWLRNMPILHPGSEARQ